jgi:hypothetical protein
VCFLKESRSVGAHATPILILANHGRPGSAAMLVKEKGERNAYGAVSLDLSMATKIRGHDENVE